MLAVGVPITFAIGRNKSLILNPDDSPSPECGNLGYFAKRDRRYRRLLRCWRSLLC